MKTRRPTIKQLIYVRGCLGNGYGDGDYLEFFNSAAEKRKVTRAIQAFDEWLEGLQGIEYKHPLTWKRRAK